MRQLFRKRSWETTRRLRWFVGFVAVAALVRLLVALLPGTPQGLPNHPRPVHVARVSDAVLNDRMAVAALASVDPRTRCRRLGLRALGLIRAVTPSPILQTSSWLDWAPAGGGVPAFYLVGTDTVFTTTDAPASLTHEYIHAIDDQLSPRMQQAVRASTDAQVATRAVIEGTAIWFQGGRSPSLSFTDDLDRNAWVLAYGRGAAYVRDRAAGDVRQAMALRPATAAEVFGLRRPVSGPVPVPTLATGERIACTDTLGVLALITAAAAAGQTAGEVDQLAHGWAGDRLDVVAGPAGSRVVWVVLFRDRDAAATWGAGPGTLLPLSTPLTIIHSVVSSPAVHLSPIDSLGSRLPQP